MGIAEDLELDESACARSTSLTGAQRDDMATTLSLRGLARRARGQLVQATLVPTALFYVGLWGGGKNAAIASALVWNLSVVGWRKLRGEPVPGMIIMGTVELIARTLVALWTGSTFIYFAQPVLGTLGVAGAFFLTAALGRPLAGRIVADLCPRPFDVLSEPEVRRSLSVVSVIWGLVHVANAIWTLWFLTHNSLGAFVAMRTAMSLWVNAVAAVVSFQLIARALREIGVIPSRGAVAPARAAG